jgi:adenosylcobinamide-GDP ribazoletransferase
MTILRERIDDVRLSFMVLTRIPVGKAVIGPSATLARAVWAYPVAGAFVGASAGAVYVMAAMAALPTPVAAAIALMASVFVTGALHEDGLADFADGLGGGRDRDSKLTIMRDSRIGTYGAVALALSFLIRWSSIPTLGTPEEILFAWIAAGALSRASIAIILWSLPPARLDGLGAAAARPPRWSIVSALALGLFIAFAAMGIHAVPLILATLAITAVVFALAKRHLNGHTGDVLGAGALSSECLCLVAAAGRWM